MADLGSCGSRYHKVHRLCAAAVCRGVCGRACTERAGGLCGEKEPYQTADSRVGGGDRILRSGSAAFVSVREPGIVPGAGCVRGDYAVSDPDASADGGKGSRMARGRYKRNAGAGTSGRIGRNLRECGADAGKRLGYGDRRNVGHCGMASGRVHESADHGDRDRVYGA